jgi:hypothetical protein
MKTIFKSLSMGQYVSLLNPEILYYIRTPYCVTGHMIGRVCDPDGLLLPRDLTPAVLPHDSGPPYPPHRSAPSSSSPHRSTPFSPNHRPHHPRLLRHPHHRAAPPSAAGPPATPSDLLYHRQRAIPQIPPNPNLDSWRRHHCRC